MLENGKKDTANGNQNKNCSCIIHKIFSGHLRSDLRCNACNFSSTSYDPFFDISLNINFGMLYCKLNSIQDTELLFRK